MGYTTEFVGKFSIDKKLDDNTYKLLKGLANTRRMKRKVDAKYGIEGEFYVEGKGFAGQDQDETISDYNSPPSTQPGLWCQWTPSPDKKSLEWDGNEKFYAYTIWLQYLIEKILKPRGYKVNGMVTWQGRERSRQGVAVC
jgi:hypothetical protein